MAQLNLTELDFEDIKVNLKSFLKSQSEFSDYNFEGSGLAIPNVIPLSFGIQFGVSSLG
jgi:hypothetical protein